MQDSQRGEGKDVTESEKRANDLWETCGRSLRPLANELALTTHMTYEEVIDAMYRAIVAAATDILDGETVG